MPPQGYSIKIRDFKGSIVGNKTKPGYIFKAGFALAFITTVIAGSIRLGSAEEKLNNHSQDLLELKEQTKEIQELNGRVERIDERTLGTLKLLEIQDKNLRLLFRSLTNRDLPERGEE